MTDGYAAKDRARVSRGTSERAIYEMVARNVQSRHPGGGSLVDVGCGSGGLWPFLADLFDSYVGVDLIRYERFPESLELRCADLNMDPLPCEDGSADVVVAAEIVEHLENPRRFVRELTRIAKPGGWIVVSTPNQESVLSLLTLLVKRRFNAFQDTHYPAHLSALLEVDLRRIASEAGLMQASSDYSERGRIPATRLHFPKVISAALPRLCSDNLMLIGRKTS